MGLKLFSFSFFFVFNAISNFVGYLRLKTSLLNGGSKSKIGDRSQG